MDTNEIMVNEEVIEVTEEIVTAAGLGKGFKVTAGVGLTVLGGFAAYKYVIRPIAVKIKAKKHVKDLLREVDAELDVANTDDTKKIDE